MKKRSIALLLSVAMAFSLAACGGGTNESAEAGSTAGSEASAEGGYKDTLVVATYGDQDTLDPQVNVTNDKVLRLLYEGLLTYNQNSEIEGLLAESWDISDDHMTWTFHLKKGVKFANGKEMTSKDVKATFDRLMNPEHPLRYSEKVEFIDSVTAVDDYTVEMKMKYAYGVVEDTLAGACCFIMDADYIDQYGYDIGIDPATINGTGPYKITSWDADEQMVFAANEYWHKGEVGTPNMIYRVIPEASSRAMAIETGEVDIVDRPGVDDVPRLQETEGITVVSQPGYGLQGFQFNCSENSMCKDPKVRQALIHAVDYETIVTALYGAIGESATHGPLAPHIFGYVDLGVPEYNPELSKQLLAEAGYPNGFDMDLMTYNGYNKAVELAEIVKAQLAEIGVNVTIDSVDGATFNDTLNGITPDEMKWDAFVMGFGGSTIDADSSMRRVMVTSEDGLNTNNYGWYSNERVDELLLGAVTELDQNKRKEMYAEAQKIVYLEDPFAMYFNLRSSLYVLTDKVEDFNINAYQVVEFEKVKVRA